jgi:hypothetical protein
MEYYNQIKEYETAKGSAEMHSTALKDR